MPKRLIVFCDGTWNRPGQRRGDTAAPTNVCKLHLALAPVDGEGTPQVPHYQAGVGTRPGERLRGGLFGLGLTRNVRDCYRFLVERYEPGDELWFFGFSRGAYTARSTVGLVRNSGLLRRQEAHRVDEALRLYRRRGDASAPWGSEARAFRRAHAHPAVTIRFVGVWDTVGSLGIPVDVVRSPAATRLLTRLARRWSFHDTDLSSHVRFAYQALAVDERRGPFRPTLWRKQVHAEDQTLEQVWFAGVHSDVGGGCADPALSEIALLWMADRARDAGLALRPDHLVPGADPQLRSLGVHVAPNGLGRMHESFRGLYRLLGAEQRDLTGDGCGLASSAVRRHLALPGYAPPGVRGWVQAGREETPVPDGGRVAVPHAGVEP